MNLLSPTEFVDSYAAIGARKAAAPPVKTLLLAVLAGAFIALGAVTACTVGHGMPNGASMRLASGVLFPFGLMMVILTGAELFTGNCLMGISVLEKSVSLGGMVKNLVIVYFGNFVGALLVAAGCAFFGQYNLSDGALAVYVIKTAAGKCAISFPNGLVMGIFCNVLVCAGVMLSLCAKDLTGRVLDAFVPVCVFVICGFEHCIANMFMVPLGIFIREGAGSDFWSSTGLDSTKFAGLTWSNFIEHNLIPVTLGNIVGGGIMIGILYWTIFQFPKRRAGAGN